MPLGHGCAALGRGAIEQGGGQGKVSGAGGLGRETGVVVEFPGDKGGGGLAGDKARVPEQIEQKALVGLHAYQNRVFQGLDQAAACLLAVFTVTNQFGQHGVVVGGYTLVLAQAVVDSHAFDDGGLPEIDGSGLRHEVLAAVFGIQAYFDGVAL